MHKIFNNVVCATNKASDRRLHRLVLVYTCQNATLLEIPCTGSIIISSIITRNCFLYKIVHFALEVWVSIEAIDNQAVANLEPNGMVGRILIGTTRHC